MQRGKTEHRFVNLHMHVLLKLPENKSLWNGFFFPTPEEYLIVGKISRNSE